jgi:hypothetical protein
MLVIALRPYIPSGIPTLASEIATVPTGMPIAARSASVG